MPTPGPNSSRRWLTTLLGLNLALYLLPFALVRIPSFEHWGGSPFGAPLDYPFTLAHTDADVLLFGDSSAAVGIDPRQLSGELGLKVISLPNTAASLQVLGQWGLDHYLANNRPPRLILFYFAPWNLDYAHKPITTHLFEGEEVLLHRGSARQILAFARQNSLEVLNFPWRFYRGNPRNALRSLYLHTDPAKEVAATQGYLDPLSRRPPQPEPCAIPEDRLQPTATVTVETLLERYRTPATEVAFTLAPLPACAGVERLTARSYPGLGAAPVLVLPPSSFKDDFNYVHLRPDSVPANTTRVAEIIRTALARKPAAP